MRWIGALLVAQGLASIRVAFPMASFVALGVFLLGVVSTIIGIGLLARGPVRAT